jgi:hypothetical protein
MLYFVMIRVRFYEEVADRIQKAAGQTKECDLSLSGEIKSNSSNYPFYALSISLKDKKDPKPVVCLSAGIHGDEPAGVEAMLILLENPDLYKPFLSKVDLTMFPCINPYGYEHNTRTNGQGLDLNRQFDKRQPPGEVTLVQEILEGKQFALSMEFHEDVDTDGFYLYELKKQEPYFGEAIIQEVSKLCPINLREEIEGMPSSGGIIRRSAEQVLSREKDWPQAIYQFRKGTPHTITSETPITLPLQDRAKLHLIAFDTALQQLLISLH